MRSTEEKSQNSVVISVSLDLLKKSVGALALMRLIPDPPGRISSGSIQFDNRDILGMTEGETRLIEIPPYLGYGRRGAAGIIPPGASLRYTVELIRVKSSTARRAEVLRDQGG